MPLKLVAPRAGRSPNWRIRGTYLKVYVDESAGTPDKATASKKLQKIRGEIERGEFSKPRGPTFLSGAVSYIESGGDERFLGEFDPDTGKWSGLIAHFGETRPDNIDQAAIDAAAVELYPEASAATRNRQVYTPVSAVLKHMGIDHKLRRPKGAQGSQRTAWLWPEDAFRIFASAKTIDAEFSILLTVLCYCGPRLSEALCEMTCDGLRIAESFAYLGHTKNGEPRAVHLPPPVVAALANHPRGLDRPGERVFRFAKNGYLYRLLRETKEAAGEDLAWVTFHTFCHTYATWMRRYAGMDSRGLLGTGRWADIKSVMRYEHVVASEESRRADLLPTPSAKRATRRTRAKSVERKKAL